MIPKTYVCVCVYVGGGEGKGRKGKKKLFGGSSSSLFTIFLNANILLAPNCHLLYAHRMNR